MNEHKIPHSKSYFKEKKLQCWTNFQIKGWEWLESWISFTVHKISPVGRVCGHPEVSSGSDRNNTKKLKIFWKVHRFYNLGTKLKWIWELPVFFQNYKKISVIVSRNDAINKLSMNYYYYILVHLGANLRKGFSRTI